MEFTGKDLCTWHATVLAVVAFAEMGDPPTSQRGLRRAEKAVMTKVAQHLGNTPAVARKSYIDPRIIRLFEQGKTIRPALRKLSKADNSADKLSAEIERAVRDLIIKHG